MGIRVDPHAIRVHAAAAGSAGAVGFLLCVGSAFECARRCGAGLSYKGEVVGERESGEGAEGDAELGGEEGD